MKLLFVIKSLSLRGGGAERVLADLTSNLAERGHRITVVSYDPPGAAYFYRFHDKVERIQLGIGRAEARAGVIETLRRMMAIRRLVLNERPDVVIGFMHSVFLPVGAALLGTGIAVIASEHIVFDHYRDRPFQALLLRAGASLFAAITAISRPIIESYPERIRNKMVVIPNPVDLGIRPGTSLDGVGRKRLLTVGRLTAQKDHRTLIEAFGMVSAEYPDWDLRIVGEGELLSELRKQVSELGLEPRVTFPGAIADIGSEYARAQIFVMPSLYESFGLATAEALASGLPVIGFRDCPGTNELILHGSNGLLVKGPHRTQALASGLRRLMSDADVRRDMGEAGPASVAQYSIVAVAGAWESLLMTIARRSKLTTSNDLA